MSPGEITESHRKTGKFNIACLENRIPLSKKISGKLTLLYFLNQHQISGFLLF